MISPFNKFRGTDRKRKLSVIDENYEEHLQMEDSGYDNMKSSSLADFSDSTC